MIAAKPPRLHEPTDLASDIAGPTIGHCGSWWPITALLWWCPQCGALIHLVAEE